MADDLSKQRGHIGREYRVGQPIRDSVDPEVVDVAIAVVAPIERRPMKVAESASLLDEDLVDQLLREEMDFLLPHTAAAGVV